MFNPYHTHYMYQPIYVSMLIYRACYVYTHYIRISLIHWCVEFRLSALSPRQGTYPQWGNEDKLPSKLGVPSPAISSVASWTSPGDFLLIEFFHENFQKDLQLRWIFRFSHEKYGFSYGFPVVFLWFSHIFPTEPEPCQDLESQWAAS